MNNKYDEIIKRINKYKNMDISEVNKDSIIDINEIKITRKKSSKHRILDFLNEVENPYFFKVDGKIVQIAFNEEAEVSADDCLYNVLKDIYR